MRYFAADREWQVMMKMQKGSFTIEASIYVPMLLWLLLLTMQSAISFYQQSVHREVYAGLEDMQVISEFYTYQIIKEIGEVWVDD